MTDSADPPVVWLADPVTPAPPPAANGNNGNGTVDHSDLVAAALQIALALDDALAPDGAARPRTVLDSREVAIRELARRTTLPPLIRIVQHGRAADTAHFTFEFEGEAPLHVRSSDVLFSYPKMTQLLAVERHCGISESTKQAAWTKLIVGLLRHAADTVDDTNDADVDDWVSQYADSHSSTDRAGAARRRSPFVDPETKLLHVNIDHFARWVKTTLMAQTAARELRLALVDLGWQDTRVAYTVEGSGRSRKRSTTRYWREPEPPQVVPPLNKEQKTLQLDATP